VLPPPKSRAQAVVLPCHYVHNPTGRSAVKNGIALAHDGLSLWSYVPRDIGVYLVRHSTYRIVHKKDGTEVLGVSWGRSDEYWGEFLWMELDAAHTFLLASRSRMYPIVYLLRGMRGVSKRLPRVDFSLTYEQLTKIIEWAAEQRLELEP